MTAEKLYTRLKLAGLLISIGLVIETATLYWAHPLTFLAFITLGSTLVVVGIGLYLFSIVSI